MENSSNNNNPLWDGSSLPAELLAGRDFAKQLKLQLLDHPLPSCSSSDSAITTTSSSDHRCHPELQQDNKSQQQQSTGRQGVVQEILESFDNALSLLGHHDIDDNSHLNKLGSPPPPPSGKAAAGGGVSPTFKVPPPVKRAIRKRSTKLTHQVRVSAIGLYDGFNWRKYGQKDILGCRYPRCYYRCGDKFSTGCKATRQVQRWDEDPEIFEVTCNGSHTCRGGDGGMREASAITTTSPSPASSVITCGEGSASEFTAMSPSHASNVVTYGEGSTLFFNSGSEFGGVQEASKITTMSPSPASSVITCREGSPLFFNSDSEFGAVQEVSAAHRPRSRTKSKISNFCKNPQQSSPAGVSQVSSASDAKTWEQKDDAISKLGGNISGSEELQLLPELEFSEFMLPELDAYGIYGNRNDGVGDKATNLDLNLGLGPRMSCGMPKNLKGSLGGGSLLRQVMSYPILQIEKKKVTDRMLDMPKNLKGSLGAGSLLRQVMSYPILQIEKKKVGDRILDMPKNLKGSLGAGSLLRQVMSYPILQIEKKKVGDRMLGMTEPIQTKVKDCAPSFEFKSSHCKNMMHTKEQLYISKSPSLKFCYAHNFVSLFFSYCKSPQLWKGGEQHLVSLKRLDTKHSNLLWIPDLSKARKLESLNLEGCANLVGISSIQHLTKLQHLNLKGCQSLKGIPSLIRLKFLKTFDLSDCSNITRLPPSLGCLPNLSELNLKNCAKLANLPRSVMHLMKSLETLNISGCSSMWKSIGDDQDGAVPLSAKPHLGFSVLPSSEATHQENLPNSNSDIPANNDSSPESQLSTAKKMDVLPEGSPPDDLPLDPKDIRGKEAIEREEEAFLRTPLISSLLSELRRALLFPPNVGSSHASTSSSHDINIQTINHTQNNKSEAEQSEIATLLQMEDQQQQLCNDDDDDHDDAKTDETTTLSAATEPILCQVEDCQIDLSGAETYHQQHKICEIHCMATAALLGNILQRFCHQCCRFHVLGDFDEEERNCRSRLAGYHQKHRRQNSAATISTKEEHSSPETAADLDAEINIAESEDENEKCLLHKRIKTVDPPEQNQPTLAVEQQSFNDWDEANAIGDIEDRVLEMIEQISRSNYADDDEKAAAAVPESVLDLLAEMEQTVPETVRSMKSAKAKATADSAEWKVADARLVIGELELRLLDMELTRISEEEEEIEAELQRLMDQKRELSQQH